MAIFDALPRNDQFRLYSPYAMTKAHAAASEPNTSPRTALSSRFTIASVAASSGYRAAPVTWLQTAGRGGARRSSSSDGLVRRSGNGEIGAERLSGVAPCDLESVNLKRFRSSPFRGGSARRLIPGERPAIRRERVDAPDTRHVRCGGNRETEVRERLE